MIDIDGALRDELERLVPVAAEPDWEAVARAAGLGSRRRRRLLVVALAALVLAGGAVAAVREAPWWQTGAPPVDPAAVASVARDNLPAHVDTSRARTVAQEGDAALVAVPLGVTGYCLIPALDGRGNLGAQCDYQVVHPEQGDDDRTVTMAHRAGRGAPATWLVYGRITDPRAADIDLGAFRASLGNGGFFLARVPEDRWAALSGTANPGRILDGSGRTLRSGCVSWGPSPASAEAGLGDLPLFHSGAGPCRPLPLSDFEPRLDLSRARRLVEFTLARDFSIWNAGERVAVWRDAAADGAVCVWVAPAAPAPSGRSKGPPGGPAECGPVPSLPPAHEPPFASISVSDGGGGLVVGHVGAGSGIAKVVLTSASGAATLPLGHGWFVGLLPAGPRVGLPPGRPFVLVGYRADGAAVARSSIDELVEKATPH